MKNPAQKSTLQLIAISASVLAVLIFFDVLSIKSFIVEQYASWTREEVSEVGCVAIEPKLTDKTVVLRVDDVQAYGWKDATVRIVEDAIAVDAPLSAAIIPNNLYDDAFIVAFLKKHKCNLEFVLHGWHHNVGDDYQTPEFADKTKDEAKEAILKGIAVLEGLGNQKVVSWVPPQNVHSDGTVEALAEIGIQYVSTEGDARLDYHAATYNYDSESLVSKEEVIEKCEEQFVNDFMCVIMIHPQDFVNKSDGSLNAELYKTYYLDLLRELKANGYTFARFKDLSL